jgi:hypothetical protein
MKVRFYDIVWDCDACTSQNLPQELTLLVSNDETAEMLNEYGADRLSEETGFCVVSFCWQTLPKQGQPMDCYQTPITKREG